ncbi:hypothetical protein LUPAC06_05374 [Micromonospora saelicesensis]|uniref:hypothetical protein n=1 Tax=Micromonospora saelicesensis TaxID=285676 RepID=UPI000DBFD043|nr:hypothetical protein [Micromonospora saelicesensis]RAO53504.1 hypothetical protein LUPAC06_05374 [Micromonospora saelicesensis]
MSVVRRTLGFSWPALVALAVLAAPRVVLHDLHVVEEGRPAAVLLAVVPLICWVAAVLWRRPPRPFLTAVVIGAIYGVLLAVGHQILWDEAFGATGPRLGDIDPRAQEAILRVAAVFSSLVTGILTGVVAGAVAAVLSRLVIGRQRAAEQSVEKVWRGPDDAGATRPPQG